MNSGYDVQGPRYLGYRVLTPKSGEGNHFAQPGGRVGIGYRVLLKDFASPSRSGKGYLSYGWPGKKPL